MTDLIAELDKMDSVQWVGSIVMVLCMLVVGIGVWQTLVARQAHAERDQRELARLYDLESWRDRPRHARRRVGVGR